MDLLSELAKEKAKFEQGRSTAEGRTMKVPSKAARSSRKRSHWLDEHESKKSSSKEDALESSKSRLRKDLQEIDDLSRSKRALELKAAKYEQMRTKGTDMLLSARDAEELMVDFDRKHYEGHDDAYTSDVSLRSDADPWVEIEDEFGRTRTIRQSETVTSVPTSLPKKAQSLIYGPYIQHFAVDSQRKDEIWKEAEQDTGETHYDPNWELRTKGTGYLNLGSGEARVERMQNLQDLRHETIEARDAVPAKTSRKQDLEARRAKLLEARAKKERESYKDIA
ncbi:hypothetical protein BCR37DRAFT_16432 [Protomyces lactucae-debilis]|uniref:Uncharacterized protein n=1 Tax=Protomyces lactucae-debilis TaxID=2754530 RepID=A0A1Y2FVB5_PROLT|nr:uncharacterized protein BCR37DRAFT_16432 [Protomyces lactucae-debilis]ORY87909.1 hypothetical protein BCR37DRAFT_16432 [Protomyces lactucae-debilis]